LLHFLKIESKLKGKKMLSIIRDILSKSLKQKSKSTDFIDQIDGLWKDKTESIDSEIRQLRKSRRNGGR
jgi:hypothetical protein